MFDLISIIKTAGYLGIFIIVFAESGLLVGFFLPGDSLLFTAGVLASQGYLNIALLCVLAFIAAVLGDSVGYWFGKKVGPRLFKKKDSLFFHQDNIDRANKFFDKHGKKSIILARFIPVVRTFAPILAGVGNMKYGVFLAFNIIGGFLWAIGITILGYFLGNVIPDVDKYLLPIILLIIVISILPTLIPLLKDKHARATVIASIKNALKKRNLK